jgi:hypothetical protein
MVAPGASGKDPSLSFTKPEPVHVSRPTSAISADATGNDEELGRSRSRKSAGGKRTSRCWKIRLFRGMVDDVRRRAPFYLSDWTDAWDYRVVPATVYMYFAK